MVATALALTAPPLAAAAAEKGIRYRDQGPAVVSLQQRLVELAYLTRSGIDGVFGDQTWHAVVAFQGWERIRRDGAVGPVTRRVLARAQRPRPWVRLRRAVEIDLSRQVLLVVRNGVVHHAIHASTAAPPYATPRGRFTVVRRERESWSRPYHVWLPYALYFHRGWAIHGYPRVPDQPASHGCIRLPIEDARLLFQQTALGTPVIVRGIPSPALRAPTGLAATAASRPRHRSRKRATRRHSPR